MSETSKTAPGAGSLDALIAQWREKADERSNGFYAHSERTIATLRSCANELGAALSALPSAGWQPMDTMPDEGQVLVCWKIRQGHGPEYDTIGRTEYLEIMGYGETPALGWMTLPAPPEGSSR